MIRDGKPGVTLERGAPGFDTAVLGTSFNGRDPGARPAVLVQANDAAEVAAAVQRAAREGLKISLCSGGHSWAQNHLRADGLLIDLSRLNHVEIDESRMLARVGPGKEGAALNDELMKRGLFFPTPHAPDVGMGGFLLQGGFGWGSRQLGLACESVVGVDVVLADGRQVHANAEQHPDLYWAVRGSGPGFFGVVTCFHLRLHRRPKAIGMAMQIFRLKHLEEVYEWADRVGPQVSRSVEFQLLMTPKAMGIFTPGIEVLAPVLADSWKEAREAVRFVTHGELKPKASLTVPLLPFSIRFMQDTAAKTHFPDGMRWCVDNMWTNAPLDQLMPGLRRIGDTLPPSPSHVLWLDWRPPKTRPDMAFSMEAERYLALYGEWRKPEDDVRYADWATANMRDMAHLAEGIQLADENLARRPARFVSDANLKRLDAIRAAYDPEGRFQTWMGRPS